MIRIVVLAGCALASGWAAAKSPEAGVADGSRQSYTVVLEQAPLAAWHGQRQRAQHAAAEAAGPGKGQRKARRRLDVHAPESRAYLALLDADFATVRGRAERAIGRSLKNSKRLRYGLNAMQLSLTRAEAEQLEQLPGVKRVQRNRVHRLNTDSGPRWIGADDIWNGVGSLPATRGQGIVIGVIDTGINAEHLSFVDPGENGPGWDHTNPFGQQLGLCSDPEVVCNDKLVGVYDFVTDRAITPFVEENTKGIDNDGHGSHVASIAAGNPLNLTVNGISRTISGVAPNANIVSYRACYNGDPDDPDDDGCWEEFLEDSIEQAIADGVDVINYSVGTPTVDSPWVDDVAEMFLNAVGAGIFVATSNGNLGPEAGTVNSPANAPWISSVGYATHNRVLANLLENMSGGAATPPEDMVGASFTDGTTAREIVYAGDHGNALCGTGTPELGAECDDNTGASNPFDPNTFNGEIVVCERGTYGRVEKGKNLQLAGAGGYVLINTNEWGESLVADDHCLPATHLGETDGNVLRTWLASGTGHMANISGFDIFEIDAAGDLVDSDSSRGPNPPPAEDVLKPNLIAPGVTILGAVEEDDSGVDNFAFLSGSSMASPHVAGAAALLLAVDGSWTPAMIMSTLELTATPEQAIDFDGLPATPLERGSGRPRLGEAANSGLFLDESAIGFAVANPSAGGDPKNLNLAGLVDSECMNACSFTRTVTGMGPTRIWTATPAGFPQEVGVTVSPAQFTLSDGNAQVLEIEIDLEGSGRTGLWTYGEIRLTASEAPDAVLTVAVFASGGSLPPTWFIASDRDSGWQEFNLAGLVRLPDATYSSGGLVRPDRDVEALPEDPTHNEPYDGGEGVFTVLLDVPEGALWLYTETLVSTAPDIDLYVGRDTNGNGLAEENEQVCQSISEDATEFCDILSPTAGTWWVLVQVWTGSGAPTDDATLLSAVIPGGGTPGISATGPGILEAGQTVPVRVAWDSVDAVPGEQFLGAVGIGTDRDHPNNIGVIPVRFTRNGISEPRTLPLANGRTHSLALSGNGEHNRIFVDVPPGATELTVAANGLDADQNNGLGIALKRVAFDDAFGEAPFAAQAPDTAPLAEAAGSGGQGPEARLSGGQLQPGRYYVVLSNANGTPSSVDMQADISVSGAPIAMHGGLWEPTSRPGISQGYEYTDGGGARALIWYTYDEDGNPVWYLAADLAASGNVWVADLLRFTNDGAEQQFVKVGRVVITLLGEQDAVFTFTLFGESGSDRMKSIIAENTCPMIDGQPRSVIGLWYNGLDGLGGASVLYSASAHFEVHYLFDDEGNPRWLAAFTPDGNSLTMAQFTGFCAVCAQGTPTFQDVGTFTHNFMSETSGNWTLDYTFAPPLSGDVNRTENIFKITDIMACD